ncbi:hypothetical protein CC85DRAFT_257159 [Cutaneotrichosporon oleaginosum]|uniref:BAH-domain-containing protein n=1 Tax=Cutaneotrichosporon oleaginosum TaxID=879819 RepID=A0A0J1B9E4_9TREE|nr:uncharacterized protein CC85DRAFT_257159 [Cutaneotrichosporon oleaginosum]KLT44444.1 hypothetical protein CC85DRAFT_257159 [Cutaneotrichosporon oleaginosum]TXT07836.1 hypothetical protein COLE_04760 [Cutaneotrichosporon oleaginosum]
MPRKSNPRPGRAQSPPSPVPQSYPGKKSDGRGLDEPLWIACRDMLDAVFKAKSQGRRMAEIFIELPDAEDYADYYQAIPDPICLNMINSRLSEIYYMHPEDFFKQLHLVFLNAMHYNEEGSQVWNDAKQYEEMMFDMWRKGVANGPFTSLDPYHKGRKQMKAAAARASAASGSASESPAVVKSELPAVDAPPVIHLRVSKPEAPPAASGSASHPPPQPPTASPASRETRGTRAAAVAATAKMTSPVKSTQHLPPPHAARPFGPTGYHGLSAENNAVVAATDASFPKWPGPSAQLPGDPAPGGHPGSGWWGEGSPDYERSVGGPASYKQRIHAVAEALAAYKDPSGNVLSSVFANIPPHVNLPYLSPPATAVPAFSQILTNARNGRYSVLVEFDMEMAKLFEKARRFFEGRPVEYGRVLTLQRLYNALTAPFPLKLPIPMPSSTLFASLPSGPGNPRTMTVQEAHDAVRAGAPPEVANQGITTYRIPSKDRIFTEEARHKGVSYRAGEYVHLINPDDASKPIIGHIFKTFLPTQGFPTHHVTVCWYYRPEQTVHIGEQMYFENEVVKSVYFCDHPIEDVIEKVAVQPWSAAEMGRPQPQVWHPGFPLYTARSRYIDKAHFLLEVKDWKKLQPEGASLLHYFTNVVPFKHKIQLPLVKSPLLRGIKGPGSIGRPKRQAMPDDNESMDMQVAYGRAAPPAMRMPEQRPPHPSNRSSFSQQAPTPHQRPTPTPGPSRTPSTPAVQQQQRGHPQQRQQSWQHQQRSQQAPTFPDRTFASVTGGAQVLEQVAVREFLPPETAKLFEQDARHQVLWFSGPPLPQGAVQIPSPPSHSLEYLAFLSKRRRGESKAAARPANGKRFKTDGGTEQVEEGDAEGEEEELDLTSEWWTLGLTPDQVFASLKTVMNGPA